MVVLLIVLLLIVGGCVAGFALLVHGRQKAQLAKDVERGLKMVPMMIYLPPSSDDLDQGARDLRDVVDENISKAQTIYNIVSATFDDSSKAKKYGQKHFGFEIIATHGAVNFYASVPVPLSEVVKQAIMSAYPSARVEETHEHNIFSSVGKLSGVVGGELELKESFAYPIATYQDIKRDNMQALLNALANLEKEDGAVIQMLIRPADPSWRKQANDAAQKKKDGKDGDKSVLKHSGAFAKDMVTALAKPPEGGDNKSADKKELSSLDQSIVDAMHDKTRAAGYEVLVRVLVSSNINQRAQALLSNVLASFSLFDAPGKNGFKFVSASSPADLVSDYLLRSFPIKKNKNILNTVELATLFHFPDQRSTPTSQLERQASKQVDGPRNMPSEGLLLGYNLFRGVKKPVYLSLGDRQRHMYAVGQTGTGKSTFLENLALQDMLSGGGFAFIDPHGDTAEMLLSMVPKERTEDVIYFCPAEMDYPMGLNLFEYDNPDQIDFLVQEALNMLYKLYDPQRQGIMGPRYEDIFRNAALAVMADPEGGTFIDIPQLFRDPQFLKKKLQHVTNQTVLDFWQKQYPASQRSNEAGEVNAWFVSKFGAFLSNEMMRNIIGQAKSSFNLREIMDEGKILIVNLSKGRTGELNSKLLGMVFVMKFQAAAMSRANVPESQRKDFALYVDEFQNFSTDSFATIMSEARKYHLNLIVANQFTTQLTEEIRDAVFGNMGTVVSFRIGQNDVESLSRYFQPQFDGDDLLRIPNHNTVVRTLIKGVPTQPFSMATLPPLGSPNAKLAEALKQLSATKYAQPKAQIEKQIFARMKTEAPPPQQRLGAAPQPQRQAYGQQGGVRQPSAQQRPMSSKGSFLDDWMAKRQSSSQQQRPAPAPAQSSSRSANTSSAQPQPGSSVLPQQPTETPRQDPQAAPRKSQTDDSGTLVINHDKPRGK